jgi:hypothetical protein
VGRLLFILFNFIFALQMQGLFPPRSVRVFFGFFELIPIGRSLSQLAVGQLDNDFPHQRPARKDSFSIDDGNFELLGLESKGRDVTVGEDFVEDRFNGVFLGVRFFLALLASI